MWIERWYERAWSSFLKKMPFWGGGGCSVCIDVCICADTVENVPTEWVHNVEEVSESHGFESNEWETARACATKQVIEWKQTGNSQTDWRKNRPNVLPDHVSFRFEYAFFQMCVHLWFCSHFCCFISLSLTHSLSLRYVFIFTLPIDLHVTNKQFPFHHTQKLSFLFVSSLFVSFFGRDDGYLFFFYQFSGVSSEKKWHWVCAETVEMKKVHERKERRRGREREWEKSATSKGNGNKNWNKGMMLCVCLILKEK